jgi:hypothetical protein
MMEAYPERKERRRILTKWVLMVCEIAQHLGTLPHLASLFRSSPLESVTWMLEGARGDELSVAHGDVKDLKTMISWEGFMRVIGTSTLVLSSVLLITQP